MSAFRLLSLGVLVVVGVGVSMIALFGQFPEPFSTAGARSLGCVLSGPQLLLAPTAFDPGSTVSIGLDPSADVGASAPSAAIDVMRSGRYVPLFEVSIDDPAAGQRGIPEPWRATDASVASEAPTAPLPGFVVMPRLDAGAYVLVDEVTRSSPDGLPLSGRAGDQVTLCVTFDVD